MGPLINLPYDILRYVNDQQQMRTTKGIWDAYGREGG